MLQMYRGSKFREYDNPTWLGEHPTVVTPAAYAAPDMIATSHSLKPYLCCRSTARGPAPSKEIPLLMAAFVLFMHII